MELERCEQMDAPFEAQRIVRSLKGRRSRYVHLTVQESCRVPMVGHSGLFSTGEISKIKSQAETERIRALTARQEVPNRAICI